MSGRMILGKCLNRIDCVNEFLNSYTFNVYQDYEDLLSQQGDVYTGTAKTLFQSVLWMIKFPSSGFYCLKNNNLSVENIEKKQLELKEAIQNIDQFAACLDNYFLMIDKQLTLKAQKNIQKRVKHNCLINKHNTFLIQVLNQPLFNISQDIPQIYQNVSERLKQNIQIVNRI
ncbi:hypothetical protein ABPG72_018177 [Tetrahymena utriculariae]